MSIVRPVQEEEEDEKDFITYVVKESHLINRAYAKNVLEFQKNI